MASASPSCWESVDVALERGDAKAAATTAVEGLRAVSYEERRNFLTQLCAVLQRRGRSPATAATTAETGEQLWAMPDFRPSAASTSAATVTGEALLLAAATATAYATLQNYAQALVFDRELLQSPAFFTYDGLTPVDRLACVARTLAACRCTATTRYVDAAVHKGMSLYHALTKASASSTRGDAADPQLRREVMCAYLFELGCYRQSQQDYLRAFQSFLALYESNREDEALCRAAVNALCIRAADGVRQAALHDVLHHCSAATLPSLHAQVHRAHQRELFRAADVAAVLAAASGFMPKALLRSALREHNILLLSKAFDCVHWRSLCVHMADADITETELYDLLVEMVRGQRISVAIHQDTGYIEFDDAGQPEARQQCITDADVFQRIAEATAVVAAARPDLLPE